LFKERARRKHGVLKEKRLRGAFGGDPGDILRTSCGHPGEFLRINAGFPGSRGQLIRSRYGDDPPELPGFLNDSRYEFFIYEWTIEGLRDYL